MYFVAPSTSIAAHEYSPIAALNEIYALSKANSKAEAEKIQLSGNHLYHALLGGLYTE